MHCRCSCANWAVLQNLAMNLFLALNACLNIYIIQNTRYYILFKCQSFPVHREGFPIPLPVERFHPNLLSHPANLVRFIGAILFYHCWFD